MKFLTAFAAIYSAATLFVMELLYQIVLAVGRGCKYSFNIVKNNIVDAFFEIASDIVMLVIDFVQAIIEGAKIGWGKARETYADFRNQSQSKA